MTGPKVGFLVRRCAAVALVTAAAAGGPVPALAAPVPAHPHGDWGSVYRSVDGGRIWQDLNRYNPVTTVYDVSAPHPGRIWEATDRGLLRSDDLGQHWRPVGPRAIGDSVTLVSEHPADGSVLVGGPEGLFRAPTDLSVWRRVLPREQGPPLTLIRDGDRVLVSTARRWYHSDDGGQRFEPGSAGLRPVNGRLVRASGGDTPSPPQGRKPISQGAAGNVTVVGTDDGAYARTAGAGYRLIPGTEGVSVLVVLAAPRVRDGGFLLGTSRGLLVFDPRRSDQVQPVQDIPPFLAVGALEIPAGRPDELLMATSVRPYPMPPPAPAPTGDGSPWRWPLAIIGVIITVGGVWWVRRRRRPWRATC